MFWSSWRKQLSLWFSSRKGSRRSSRHSNRGIRLEPLEKRQMLAVDLFLFDSPLDEAGGVAQVVAQLDSISTSEVVVHLNFSGTADFDVDYTADSTSIVIPAGELTGSIFLTALPDDTFEGDETIIVDIDSVEGDVANGVQQVIATITDDDFEPTVDLEMQGSPLQENGGVATVVATLSNPTTQSVTITLDFSGSATEGVDYTPSASSIVILPGELSGSITLTGLPDAISEVDETIEVRIGGLSNASENGVQLVTATIIDNHPLPTVALTIDNATVSENGGVATVTATLSETSAQTVTLELSLSGAAVEGLDYTANTTTIVILPGDLSGSIVLTATADAIDEADEAIIVSIANATNADTAATLPVQTLIEDENDPPTVSLNVSTTEIHENAQEVVVTATLSETSGQTVVVHLDLGGTATNLDYTATSTSIVILPGELTGSVTITAVDDAIDEEDEDLVINFDQVENATANLLSAPQVVTIVDNDEPPTVTLSLTQTSISENGGSTLVIVTLSEPSGKDVVVDLAFSGSATLLTDYAKGLEPITILAGEVSGSVLITAIDDDIFEGNESIEVSIQSLLNATEAVPQLQTITILESTAAPQVTLDLQGGPIDENGGEAVVVASIGQTAAIDVTVNLSFSGQAQLGVDYTASSLSITIPAGSLSGSITLTGLDDLIPEGNETIVVDIQSVVNGVEANGFQQVTATILDDEPVPTVTLTFQGSPLAENGGTGLVVATLSETSPETVTVQLIFNGQAMFGTDYTASTTTITILAGDLSGSATVTASDDNVFEGDESIVIDVGLVTGANENGVQQVTATIADDETQPAVTLQLSGSPFSENGGTATVTALLSNPSTQDVTVFLSFDGTAIQGSDYTAPASILIPAGQVSGSATIFSLNDDIHEPDETIEVSVGSATNASFNASEVVVATLEDDDHEPDVELQLSGSPLAENGGVAVVTAVLTNPSSEPTIITLDFTGSATFGADYTAATNTITIPAFALSASLTLTGIDDGATEGSETIIVTIASLSANATENVPQQLTATIIDDETQPSVTLSLDPTSVIEGAGPAQLTATLSQTSSFDVTIILDFAGNATFGVDYTAATSFTILAGDLSASIPISIIDDTLDEDDETFVVTIANVINGQLLAPQQVTGTITSNDLPPTVSLSLAGNPMEETGGQVTVTATLTETSAKTVIVALSFGGTAILADDYQASSTSITILPGQLSGSITLTPIDDAIPEDAETIVIDAFATNATLANGSEQITATILANDLATVTLSIQPAAGTLPENNGVGTIIATLSNTVSQSVTVTLAISGNATPGSDYTMSDVVITIPAGELSGSVTVTALPDDLDEPIGENEETIIVNFGNITGGVSALDPNQTVKLRIIDDNSPPLVDLLVSNTTIDENGGSTVVTVQLSQTSAQTVQIELSFAGTATLGADYTRSNGATITIPAGQLSASFTITALDDNISEGNETIRIDIVSTGNNATENGSQSRTITIIDDDAPTLTLTVSQPTVTETDAQSSTITATLDKTASQPITIPLSFSGTATFGLDYTLSAISITIPAGQLSGSITLTAINDNVFEPNETVQIFIADGGGAFFSNANPPVITIIDNDVQPVVSISASSLTLAEAGGTTQLTATLDHPSAFDVTVQLSFAGTATFGLDYTSLTSIVIPANSLSASITVQAINDATVEGNETIQVSLAGAINGTVSTNPSLNQLTLTIIDDDSTSPTNITITDGSGNTSTSSTNYTTFGTPTFTVNAGAGQVIEFLVDGVVVATATDSGTPGQYTATFPLGRLQVGENSVTTRIAGSSDASAPMTVIYAPSYDELFTVPGAFGEARTVTIMLPARQAAYRSEVGLYVADDLTGAVNGVPPTSALYARTVLQSAGRQILFAPNAAVGSTVTVTLTGGQVLGFYLIQNSTSAAFLRLNPNNQPPLFGSPTTTPVAFFSFDSANPDGVRHVQVVSDPLTGRAEYRWEDLWGGGDRDYNDLVIFVNGNTGAPNALETLRVPGAPNTVAPATFSLLPGTQGATRTSGEVGVFRVDNVQGAIGSLLPGNPGYAQAALNRRTTVFGSGAAIGSSQSVNLNGGDLVGIYMIRGGTAEQALASNPTNSPNAAIVALFSFDAANPDAATEHFRFYGVETVDQGTSGQGTDPDDIIVHAMDKLYGNDLDFDKFRIRIDL